MLKKTSPVLLLFLMTALFVSCSPRTERNPDRSLTISLGTRITTLDPALAAQGMYTEEKKCVLYCVVSRKEIVRVKEIVNDVDSSAFVIVSDVREVLGEGFLEYSDDF